jgi:hypothetical protein
MSTHRKLVFNYCSPVAPPTGRWVNKARVNKTRGQLDVPVSRTSRRRSDGTTVGLHLRAGW